MGWKLWVIIGVIVALLGGTGYLAFAYISTNSDLTEANSTIDDYVIEVADLEQDVDTLTDDLDTMTAERDTLLADKATLEAENADLEDELDDANSEISSLEYSLNSMTIELYSETARADALQSDLNTVTYPRHFNSVQELSNWLQQDDTNVVYAYQDVHVISYILQVRALQDGYILPADVDIISGTNYWSNSAVINGTIYWVYAWDDDFEAAGYCGSIPTYPISQGQ